MELVVCLCLVLGVSLNVDVGVAQFSEEPPEYIVALQGDTILMRCGVVSYITATLSWQERDKGQIITKGSRVDPGFTLMRTTRSRISVIGDRSNGEYYLQIRDVVGSDSGRYACHFYDDNRRQDYYSNAVTLTVFTPPARGFPKCRMDPTFARIGVGENVTLSCRSEGGNPPAVLTWLKGREFIKEKITPRGYPNVHNLSITLTDEDVDQNYMCVAINPTNRKRPVSCFVKPLRSAIGVKLQPSTQTADPGTRATFSCVSEVVPGLVFTWYFNGRPIKRPHRRFNFKKGGSKLKIYPVIHSDDTAEIKCVVSQPDSTYNLTGSATALLWVNVDANPNFVWETTTAPPLPTTTIPPTTTKPTTTQPITTPPTTTVVYDTTKPETTTPTLKPTTTIPKPIAKDNPSTPLSRDSNVLCRGDTCVAIATEETNTNTTYVQNSTNPSNEIEVNLPPDTEYQNDFAEQNEIPDSSKHKAEEENGSSGLAIGLSLTFIFLAIIVGVGVFLIWRYKFREQPKGKGRGKAKTKGKGKKKKTQILRDNLNKINLTKITSLHKK